MGEKGLTAEGIGNDLLHAALSQLSEGVIVADAKGRLVFVNEAAARLHGVAQLDVAADAYASVYRLFTVEGDPYPSESLPLARAVLHGDTVIDASWRIRRADGTDVLAVGSARPVLDAAGAQVGSVLTIRDDTARAAAADAVRDRGLLARQLRAAFDQSPVSTVVYDSVGRPLAVNPAFERLWGATLSDVPADYSVLADPQLEAAGVLPLIQRAFDGEASSIPPIPYEMDSGIGRGRVLWTQAHLYPVRDANGTVDQVVLTHEDVTARRAAETALSAALERALRLQALSAALSMASTSEEVGAVVVARAQDVLGAASIMIARLSPSGAQLEVMNVGAIPPDILEPWRTFQVTDPVPLADVARTGEPIFLENRSQWIARYPHLAAALNGTGHQATASTPLIVNGVVLGALGAAFDTPQTFDADFRSLALTVAQQCAQALERSRLLEAERAARAEAEAANLAKSDFLAVMSHELRTPLNAIGGYTELIAMGVRGPVSSAQHKDLERIQTSQRHLLGLINEVLNYAKLESGSVQYELSDVLVGEALTNAQGLVGPQAQTKGLLLFTGPCDGNLKARCDREKLQQILVNLLSNAVKFTDTGEIEIGCRADGDRVRVTLRDTGIGIPRDQLARIFEPFVQVRSDLTRTAEGTGLGLAISRDLARAMGGDLVADSEPGHGSRFTLFLPRA